MKNNIFKLMMTFSVIAFVFSCGKINEEKDLPKNLEEWQVKNNNIDILDRETLMKFPVKYHKRIMKDLSSQEKKNIWKEKMDYIMNMNLSSEELLHLSWYKDQFDKFNYEKHFSDEMNESLLNHSLEGIERFSWTNQFVYEMFFTIGDVGYKKSGKKKEPEFSMAFQDEEEKCNCKYDFSCPANQFSCSSICDEEGEEENCGFFGGAPCTKYCFSY